jgi:glutathione reductase (NADPH)
MKTYDAIVIGSGVSGLSAAYGLKEAGKTVLVVEEDLWGGTCPNRGCDPKKVLLSAVEARNRVKQLSGKGFNEIPTANWEELQKFKQNIYGSSPRKPKKTISRS